VKGKESAPKQPQHSQRPTVIVPLPRQAIPLLRRRDHDPRLCNVPPRRRAHVAAVTGEFEDGPVEAVLELALPVGGALGAEGLGRRL
jgi:hypothetical protein